MNYYNEWDKGAAAWLRELIKQGHIPFGVVDERSITEVRPEDLDWFTQCHFFAGIGGWPLALRLAGVPEDAPLWTGSPPCQPFSAAGKQLGQFDPRHLAPVFLDLISECRPPVLFGEQVAPAIAKSWMCDLQTHLEREDYAVGFAVLPACSVGAPHKRERLFFGAHKLADTDSKRLQRQRKDSDSQGREGQNIRQAGLCYGTRFDGGVADADGERWRDGRERKGGVDEFHQTEKAKWGQRGGSVEGLCAVDATNTPNGFWSDAD